MYPRKGKKKRKHGKGETARKKRETGRTFPASLGVFVYLAESRGPLAESSKRETLSPPPPFLCPLAQNPVVISASRVQPTLNSVALQTDKFREEDWQRETLLREARHEAKGDEGVESAGLGEARGGAAEGGWRVSFPRLSYFSSLSSPPPPSRRLAPRSPVIYRCLGVRSLRNYVPPRPLVNGL